MSIDENTIRRRLKEIRKGLGLTENDVAQKLGKTYNSYVSRIESGQQKLNIEIINELASVYNIQPITLFQESAQSINKPKDFFSRAEFRTDSHILSDSVKAKIKSLLPSLRKIGKAMKAMEQPYLQLNDFYSLNKRASTKNPNEAKRIGQEAAKAFRAKFNIGEDPIANIQFFIWHYTKIPVCGTELDPECWGVYSKDNYDNPLILYSTEHKFRERNVFTIAHELGHHFFNSEEGHIDFTDDGQNTINENLANGFAQELLVPTKTLNDFFEDKGLDSVELKPLHIIDICKYFNVSFRMMAYVLYLQKKISLNDYNRFKAIKKSELEKLNYPDKETQLHPIEMKYYLRDAVITALRKGAINKLIASEMLDITTEDVEALV